MTDRTAPDVVLGRYALGEVLGHGGSATVYRAWDRHTGRAVALKRFAPGADGPDRHRQRAEVRTLARLDHPGLVRLLDAGAEDGQAHLVTDLVEGPTLAQRLAEGCLPVVEVAALGASLAEALAYIHAAGVTHRDVKPANVLLDPRHGPRLADFGIARLVDATRVTATDAVVGTAAYMAPEQLRGGEVGPDADVYALGLVLLEAATGGLGLPGTGLEVVLTRLTTPPSIPAELPGPLRTLLQTMTDGSPRRRPSARQVAAALGAFDEETTVFSRSAITSAWPGRRRRRTAVVAVGVLVAAAVAILFVLGVAAGPTGGAGSVVATSPVPGAPASSGAGPAGTTVTVGDDAERARPVASVGVRPVPVPAAPPRTPTARPAAGSSKADVPAGGGNHAAEDRGSGEDGGHGGGDGGGGSGRGGGGHSGDDG